MKDTTVVALLVGIGMMMIFGVIGNSLYRLGYMNGIDNERKAAIKANVAEYRVVSTTGITYFTYLNNEEGNEEGNNND